MDNETKHQWEKLITAVEAGAKSQNELAKTIITGTIWVCTTLIALFAVSILAYTIFAH